jgi:hypothetical protein
MLNTLQAPSVHSNTFTDRENSDRGAYRRSRFIEFLNERRSAYLLLFWRLSGADSMLEYSS